jgi:hypothetical protein
MSKKLFNEICEREADMIMFVRATSEPDFEYSLGLLDELNKTIPEETDSNYATHEDLENVF